MDNLLHPRLMDTVEEGDGGLQPHALQELQVVLRLPVGRLGADLRHELAHELLSLAPGRVTWRTTYLSVDERPHSIGSIRMDLVLDISLSSSASEWMWTQDMNSIMVWTWERGFSKYHGRTLSVKLHSKKFPMSLW